MKKYVTEDIDYLLIELQHWKERCEDLEVELMLMQSAFPEHDNDIKPKGGTNF